MVVACQQSQGPVRTTSDKTKASTAAGEDETKNEGVAQVRIVQAIPEAPKADVFTGDRKQWTVDFGTVTPYKAVAEQRFTIALKPADQPDGPVMIQAKEGVDAGHRYTILAAPDKDGAAKIDVISDDEPAPAAGKAKLRVIDVAPQAGTVDIYPQGDKKHAIVDNIDMGSPASYREVDPSAVTIEVKAKGDAAQKGTLASHEETLEAGKLYTLLVVSGEKAGKPVDVIKIVDQVAPAQAAVVDTSKASGKQPAIQREDYDNPDYEIHPDADTAKPKDTSKK